MSAKPALLHFKFDNFADLPSEVGDDVHSEPQTDCNGNKWVLELYPGGEGEEDDGWVSLFLFSQNGASNDVAYSFTVKDSNGVIVLNKDCSDEFLPNESWGREQFMKRSEILDPSKNILREGALYIDVTIQVKDKKYHLYEPGYKLNDNMLSLFKSGERADASFKIGETTFPVHSLIIHLNAPILANYLDQSDTKVDVSVEGISAKIFEHVLVFVYSEYWPTDDVMLDIGKDLIDAANKYELINLKMAAENALVRQRILTTTNVSDYILFADARSCPLLKEYAISFFLLHVKDVLKSEHSKCLKESGELLSEIMMQMADEDTDTMTIDELRKELGNRELDVDGSKETLMSRLDEAMRQRIE